jgi:GNAT superfamily N-acetyltransferase
MIEIREATIDDRRPFDAIWVEYIEEQRKYGGEMVATVITRTFFDHLFKRYVNGTLDGVVLFAVDDKDIVGVVMWGEFPMDYETNLGKVARGATYIKPAYRQMGIGTKIRDAADAKLKEMGFKTHIGIVYPGNDAGRISWEKRGGQVFGTAYMKRI